MLIENVIIGVAFVFAVKRMVFQDKLKNILLFGAIAAVAATYGQISRGTPMKAVVMAPLAFALMAGGIELCHYLERKLEQRALARRNSKNGGTV